MSSIAQALAKKVQDSGENKWHASKVVCTGKQDRVGNTRKLRSGTDVWRLQQGQAARFEQCPTAAASDVGPPGFEECEIEGWLYSKQRRLFLEPETGKLAWLDPRSNAHREYREGGDHDGAVRADGCGAPRADGCQGRKVIIANLHEAADALKKDLSHLDRPSAYLAVFGRRAGTASAAPPDAAAKTLHLRLLERLAEQRGDWSDEDLQDALAGAFEEAGKAIGDAQDLEASVALLLGGRLVTAASHGARGLVVRLPAAAGDGVEVLSSVVGAADGASPATVCVALDDAASQGAVLTCGDARLGEGDAVRLVAPWLQGPHCRAGCAALHRAARAAGAEGALVAVAAQLTWGSAAGGSAKRARKEPGGQVRCRHILVRYANCKQPPGVIGSRPPVRSQEEAEAIQLRVLEGLELPSGSPPAPGAQTLAGRFTAQCRAASECASAHKGGELAGDLGWLDPAKKYGKAPGPIPKVAAALQVGQVSDIVATELGLHVVMRTA